MACNIFDGASVLKEVYRFQWLHLLTDRTPKEDWRPGCSTRAHYDDVGSGIFGGALSHLRRRELGRDLQ